MTSSLVTYLCGSPFMRVLRSLHRSDRPRHLRDLCRSYELSPGGVADILRRLEELNLVRSSSVKNRKYYTLSASPDEIEILEALFEPYEAALVAERAPLLEEGAASKLRWMDDTHEFFRQIKAKSA